MRYALALLLVIASGQAAALGLGQIVVHSRLDQPLLAEIPIISSDPSELEQLQARLASPETFARVGLEPPRGVVSDLRFMVALDNAGNPVIRITSSQPVNEAMLTFLVEVDWGQGRLVREYSALLDAPRTVSAPVQPAIDAPVVAQPNLIERAPEPLPVDPAAPDIATDTTTPPGDTSAGEAVDDGIAPTAAPPAPARPARPVSQIQGDSYRVAGGDTLSGIASRIRGVRGLSMNQTMVALLRANPDAFIDGNIHRVKAGVVLQVPGVDEVFSIGAAEANAVVREQTRQWRQGRTAVPQPAVADGVAGPTPADGSAPTQASPGAVADARLEIVPAGAADNAQAGNQSGASAGGEGDMLRQEMQARETLAARDAELAEMKARLTELETLQKQQQQLIEMKDSELAAAQQQLAVKAQAAEASQGSVLPWLVGGAGMLVLGLLIGFAMRRRPARSVFRAPDASSPRSSLADAFPGAASLAASPSQAEAEGVDEVDGIDDDEDLDLAVATADGPGRHAPVEMFDPDGVDEEPVPEATDEDDALDDEAPGPVVAATPAIRGEAGQDGAPAWASSVAATPSPAWHTGDEGTAGARVEEVEPAPGAGGGNERLELARAYMALGDHDSARQLLGEVRLHGDLAARQQAMQMLRELE